MPKDDDNVIALCVDCGSTIPDAKAAKDPFLAEGQNGICPYCGGVVVVTYAEERESIMERRRNGEVL